LAVLKNIFIYPEQQEKVDEHGAKVGKMWRGRNLIVILSYIAAISHSDLIFMDAFDQIPGSRPKQRTNSPLATKSPFNFTCMEDTPPGARFERTATGFKASGPTFNGLMILLYGGMSFFLALLLAGGLVEPETPLGFVIILGGGLAFTVPILLFYLLGREGIEFEGDRLKLRKTFLGVGFPKSMTWRSIERVQVRRRKTMEKIADIGPDRETWLMGNLAGHYLEIESATHIKQMGGNLSDAHIYYMRYLIIETVKASRNLPK
jgi:hypothetical protein